MRTRWITLAAGALACAVAVSRAQEPAGPEDVSEIVASVLADAGVPALGGAIVGVDGLEAIGVAGVRVHGGEENVTKDDLWHLGSCTKAMTATLVARLDEKERLSLDAPLPKALPDLAKSMDDGWKDVPLAWLLQNRGGAPASLDAGGLWSRLWRFDGTPTAARRLLASEVLAAKTAYEPGTANTYSNAGFSIAGYAAEAREKTSWEELLRREVFEPLGIEHAGFGPPGDAKLRDQPFAHRATDEGPVPVPPGPGADNPVAIGPAGIVHASLADWAKFVREHLRGARGEEGLTLSPGTFRRLHTPPEGQSYAMGWVVDTRPWAKSEEGTGRVLWHNGSNTMWYCVTWLAPERGFAVLTTSNMGGERATKACDALCGALIRHRLGR